MKEDKIFLSVLAGLISSMSQKYSVILILVLAAIVFDFATGLLKSAVKGKKISSRTGVKGFWKKISLIAALFFGIFLDVFIPCLLSFINVTLPFNVPFGFIFGCYIIINESISISENLFECNPKILPKWVNVLLQDARSKIENKESDKNDK